MKADEKDLKKMLSEQAAPQKQKISNTIKGEALMVEEKKRGRKPAYNKGDPKCNMTLVISSSRRDKVKLYALLNHTTVSDLFSMWIDEHCDVYEVLEQ